MTSEERERLFADLYAAHEARVRRFCSVHANSPAESDDLFQDVMLNVWKGVPGFRGDAAIATWIYRIAVNTALMHRRKPRREVPLVEPVQTQEPARLDEQDHERQLAALHVALRSLKPPDRLCLTLLLEGLSYKDIADVTGMTVSHVGVKVSRAKRDLRNLIGDRDGWI